MNIQNFFAKKISEILPSKTSDIALKDLSIINQTPSIKFDVLRFIEDNSFLLKYETENFLSEPDSPKKIFAALHDLIKKITDKHQVDSRILYTYFSLDTTLYPKLNKYYSELIDEKNLVKGDDKNEFITGNSIEQIFKEDNGELIEQLLEHSACLPTTTRTYINRLIEEEKPNRPFKKITNEFEYNVFLNILNKQTSVIELNKYFQQFKSLEDRFEKLISMYFLHKALRESKSTNYYEQVKTSLLDSLFSTLEKIYKEIMENRYNNVLGEIYTVIKRDKEFIKILVEHLQKNKKHWRLNYFLLFLAEDKEDINRINDLLLLNINKGKKLSGVDLKETSEEFRTNFLKENKKQFYKEHPNFKVAH